MPVARSGDADVWWDSTGNGTPVVLINGLSSPSAVWFRLVPLLAPHHRVITFDNLGTGQTLTPFPFSMSSLAQAAATVIEAAGESASHVLAISMGGLIAQELTLDHPGLVSSLILVSTHAGAQHMKSDQASLDAITRAVDLPPEERTRVVSALAYSEGTPHERIEEDLRVRAQYPTSPEGYRAQLEATEKWERLDELKTIGCPTLILHGAQDRLVSVDNARQLAQEIPESQLIVLPDCGHQLFTDQPDKGARAVLDFLSTVQIART